MSEPEGSVTTPSQDSSVPIPWWIRFCRWLWALPIGTIGSLLLAHIVVTLWDWLRGSKDAIAVHSPLIWLINQWHFTFPIALFLLLLILLTWVISQRFVPAMTSLSVAQQNRGLILRRLRYTYTDLLTQSLQGIAQMDLDFTSQRDAVQSAATLLLHLPHQEEQCLPSRTPIYQIYEKAEHELLILGAPGAGKTTLLIQLAHQLVAQAEQDDTQQLPVLLPLSSWAVAQTCLQEWLAKQIARHYGISEQLAYRWVQEEQIIPLLDGLDEMGSEARSACIDAINDYHREHPGPMVVCSRKAEYEESARHHRLILQSAIIVQPLSTEQVNTYLTSNENALAALRRVLNKNSTLRELTSTPLMLSVLTLTYRGTSVRLLSQKEPKLQQQVWGDYVERMVVSKGSVNDYPLEWTRLWLHWLAQQMRARKQTIFYLEHLRPDWLSTQQQQAYAFFAVRLPAILVGALAGLFVASFFITSHKWSRLECSVLGGFLGGLFSIVTIEDALVQSGQRNGQLENRTIKKLAVSALVGSLMGLSVVELGYVPSQWLRNGFLLGLIFGSSSWLLEGLIKWLSRLFQTTKKIIHWQYALSVAVIIGGDYGLYSIILSAFGGNYDLSRYAYSLANGLANGLLFGVVGMLTSLILQILGTDIQLSERLQWSRHSLLKSLLSGAHCKKAFFFAGTVALVNAAVTILEDLKSWSTGKTTAFYVTFFSGLISGLAFGLSYWLLLGLFQGITHEQIEDRDRQVPNQGIQRSLHTSKAMGVISGGAIWIISTLSVVLIVMFSNSSDGLSSISFPMLAQKILTGAAGGVLVCALSGGMAVWRHYIICQLLSRARTFPVDIPAFLNDAQTRTFLRRVGGGYLFMHHLLLDYFADMETESTSQPTVELPPGFEYSSPDEPPKRNQ